MRPWFARRNKFTIVEITSVDNGFNAIQRFPFFPGSGRRNRGGVVGISGGPEEIFETVEEMGMGGGDGTGGTGTGGGVEVFFDPPAVVEDFRTVRGEGIAKERGGGTGGARGRSGGGGAGGL